MVLLAAIKESYVFISALTYVKQINLRANSAATTLRDCVETTQYGSHRHCCFVSGALFKTRSGSSTGEREVLQNTRAGQEATEGS